MDPSQVIVEFKELVATKYCFLAAYVVLVYDFIILFSSEVRCVWAREKGLVDYLYFAARYGVLACVPVIFSAYFSPTFTPEICKHFSLWVAFYALSLFIIPSCIMIIRVHALYNRNRVILALLVAWQCALFAVATWSFTFPGEGPLPVPYLGNENFYLCTNVSSPSLGSRGSVFFWLQSGFDITVIALTINNVVRRENVRNVNSLLKTIRRDGLLYFGVIFASNLTWVVMIMVATTGLKYIAAPITGTLTVVMICRITLNLRDLPNESGTTLQGKLSTVVFARQQVNSGHTPDTADWTATGTTANTNKLKTRQEREWHSSPKSEAFEMHPRTTFA